MGCAANDRIPHSSRRNPHDWAPRKTPGWRDHPNSREPFRGAPIKWDGATLGYVLYLFLSTHPLVAFEFHMGENTTDPQEMEIRSTQFLAPLMRFLQKCFHLKGSGDGGMNMNSSSATTRIKPYSSNCCLSTQCLSHCHLDLQPTCRVLINTSCMHKSFRGPVLLFSKQTSLFGSNSRPGGGHAANVLDMCVVTWFQKGAGQGSGPRLRT